MLIQDVLLLLERVNANFQVTRDDDTRFTAEFNTPTQRFGMSWHKCKFQDEDYKHFMYWEFSFGNINPVTGEMNFNPTGKGEQNYVLMNCIEFCKQFKTNHPKETIGCSFELDSQSKLYSRMFKQIWPEYNFDYVLDCDNTKYIIGNTSNNHTFQTALGNSPLASSRL